MRAYTVDQIHFALAIGAVVGWLFYAVPVVFDAGFQVLLWTALVGLPIAFVSVWFIGLPILTRVAERPIGWRQAAVWGSVIAAAIALVQTLVWRLISVLMWQNPNARSQIGSGEQIREIDGILTLYGWQLLAQETLIFIVLGATTGLIARAVIGAGQAENRKLGQGSVE